MPKKMSEEANLAVISTDIGYIKKSLTKIETSMENFQNLYALKADVEKLREEVETLKNKDVEDLKSWKNRLVGAFVGIQLVWAAVVYFMTGHHL